MAIQVWDYRAEYEAEREDILAAVDQVARSGRLILGESVRNFERELAEYCGAGHGVGVGSGTDALVLALRALDMQPGDEVITTSNTAIPTVSAIVTAGGTPRFVDIERDTYLMDVSQLDAAVTERTRCILPVHLFGQCVAMDRVRAAAGRRGIAVLEDCAQSTGAEQAGRRTGSLSDIAAFSFYPTKVLGGYGDGGMVITSDEALATHVRRLRMYGTEGRYFADEHGHNSRLDELHAEILRRAPRHLCRAPPRAGAPLRRSAPGFRPPTAGDRAREPPRLLSTSSATRPATPSSASWPHGTSWSASATGGSFTPCRPARTAATRKAPCPRPSRPHGRSSRCRCTPR